MSQHKSIAIIGATSAIAEHCARLWVQNSNPELVLVVRDEVRGRRIAADLQVRNPQAIIQVIQSGFIDTREIEATVNHIAAQRNIDTVLIAHGSLPEQATCESDLNVCREALEVNAISPVLFAEAFAQHMAKSGKGTIAIIGSVAGDRGRKSNYVYGSAKGLVTRYAQGLQHRFANTAIKIVLIKPGPTDTPMTAHLKAEGMKLAAVEDVASDIVTAIAKGKAETYVPSKWRLIMLIIMHLPNFIFKKMNI